MHNPESALIHAAAYACILVTTLSTALDPDPQGTPAVVAATDQLTHLICETTISCIRPRANDGEKEILRGQIFNQIIEGQANIARVRAAATDVVTTSLLFLTQCFLAPEGAPELAELEDAEDLDIV